MAAVAAIAASRKRIAPFRLFRPSTVEALCELKRQWPDALLHAGGIDLVNRMKAGLAAPAVIDLGALDAIKGVRQVGDIKLLARTVSGIEIKDLKSLADDGKKQVGSGVVAIVGVTGEGKAGIVVGVTADLIARFNAVELVRRGAEALGGKGGGGRPDMAQAGGPDGGKAEAALDAIAAALGGA